MERKEDEMKVSELVLDSELVEADKFKHPCGASSSKVPRLDYVSLTALRRLAKRYATGLTKHGKYNYKQGLTDKEYILERCAHVIEHAYKYIEVLEGQRVDDGDDNAAAIMWGGAFLCESDEARKEAEESNKEVEHPRIEPEDASAIEKFKKLFTR